MSREVRLDVEGMTCGHCSVAVQSTLEGIEGVTNVKVHLERGSARARVVDGVETEALIEAVSAIGYHANLEGQL